jgi:hypothetical protein
MTTEPSDNEPAPEPHGFKIPAATTPADPVPNEPMSGPMLGALIGVAVAAIALALRFAPKA